MGWSPEEVLNPSPFPHPVWGHWGRTSPAGNSQKNSFEYKKITKSQGRPWEPAWSGYAGDRGGGGGRQGIGLGCVWGAGSLKGWRWRAAGAGPVTWQGQADPSHTPSPSTFARAVGSLIFLNTPPAGPLPGQTKCSTSLRGSWSPLLPVPRGLQMSLSDTGLCSASFPTPLLTTLGADPFLPSSCSALEEHSKGGLGEWDNERKTQTNLHNSGSVNWNVDLTLLQPGRGI